MADSHRDPRRGALEPGQRTDLPEPLFKRFPSADERPDFAEPTGTCDLGDRGPVGSHPHQRFHGFLPPVRICPGLRAGRLRRGKRKRVRFERAQRCVSGARLLTKGSAPDGTPVLGRALLGAGKLCPRVPTQSRYSTTWRLPMKSRERLALHRARPAGLTATSGSPGSRTRPFSVSVPW